MIDDTTELAYDPEEDNGAELQLSKLVVSGSGTQSVPLDQEVIRIGTGRKHDIVLENADADGPYCQIWAQRDHYVLIDKDTGSRTHVNGSPVDFHLLKQGDRIQIGNVVIDAVYDPAEQILASSDTDGTNGSSSESINSKRRLERHKEEATGTYHPRTQSSSWGSFKGMIIGACVVLLLVFIVGFALV